MPARSASAAAPLQSAGSRPSASIAATLRSRVCSVGRESGASSVVVIAWASATGGVRCRIRPSANAANARVRSLTGLSPDALRAAGPSATSSHKSCTVSGVGWPAMPRASAAVSRSSWSPPARNGCSVVCSDQPAPSRPSLASATMQADAMSRSVAVTSAWRRASATAPSSFASGRRGRRAPRAPWCAISGSSARRARRPNTESRRRR